MNVLAGFDIGGTKCAVVLGAEEMGAMEIIAKRKFPTPGSPGETLERLMEELESLLEENPRFQLEAIGISCGGPLDSRKGLILSPPNLPGWDRVDIVSPIRKRFHIPVGLQNDANACALAEWKWGAGKGTKNMIFLTFGTGMGAGLILDGKLYTGTNDMAGEVGHIRMEEDGPIGYGKAGSFEGFCSGGGIARLAQKLVQEWLKQGKETSICRSLEGLPDITARTVAEAAREGDQLAVQIFRMVGTYLGRALAILVDVLNPERIVIGSIYARQKPLLESVALEVLAQEALPLSLKVCEIVPSGLGENVGDFAALSVARYALERRN
jgi:glucokinase